jgi:membrane-associated protein
MSELVAGVLDGLAGLNTTALYLLTGLFTALETSVGIGLLVPGDGVVLLAGTTATTSPPVRRPGHHDRARVAGRESVGYSLGRRYCLRLRAGRLGRRLGEDRWAAAEVFLAGRAVVAAAFAVVLTVRTRPVPSPASSWRRPAKQPSPAP